jgi:hypothetical protein
MIKITVEIVPFGNVEDTRKIWELEVGNVKTDEDNMADYIIYLIDHDEKKARYFNVTNHKRDAGLVRLLSKVFKKMDEEL